MTGFYAMLRNLNFTFKAMGQEGFQAGEWHGQFAFSKDDLTYWVAEVCLDLRWNYVQFCILDENGDAERVKEKMGFLCQSS